MREKMNFLSLIKCFESIIDIIRKHKVEYINNFHCAQKPIQVRNLYIIGMVMKYEKWGEQWLKNGVYWAKLVWFKLF